MAFGDCDDLDYHGQEHKGTAVIEFLPADNAAMKSAEGLLNSMFALFTFSFLMGVL